MKKLNDTINRYFGVILFGATLTGLFLPDIHINVNNVIVIALAFIIFISFFKVKVDKTLVSGDFRTILLFFIIRFIALPVILYFTLIYISEYYAIVIFILLILPSAVSSPAFANMFNGNIAMALKIMIFSSFLTILTLPLLCKFVLTGNKEIDVTGMFYTMIYTIIVPFIIHLPFKSSKKTVSFLTLNSPLLTVTGLSAIYLLAIIKNKDIIMANPMLVIFYTLISVLIFLILYISGFKFIKNKDIKNKISFSICSGANNVGLGVAITALYFTEEINVFFITAQLAWIVALIPIRYFFFRYNK